MANTWYPVIDYALCVECGTCINFCPHNVYDKAKSPSPVVTNTIRCIDHCHGCGNKCPVGAIAYAGEDTSWTPPKGGKEATSKSCCCGSESEQTPGCEDTQTKKALIEYLYLDLTTCERCIATDAILEEVMITLMPALEKAGYSLEYKKTEMTSPEMAAKYQFLSSPTIRVNGRDVGGHIAESSCGCCGKISGTDVDCRVFQYEGKRYEIAPREMLAGAILEAVFSESNARPCANYTLPENLKRFYEGKSKKEQKAAAEVNAE